jgi:hypothetical protein
MNFNRLLLETGAGERRKSQLISNQEGNHFQNEATISQAFLTDVSGDAKNK